MSASSKKKLRKEQNAAAMTEKQQKEAKEAKKLKAYTMTFVVVMILVLAITVGIALRTPISSAISRGTKAVTIGDHELSSAMLSYFYVDTIISHYNQYYSSYGDYGYLYASWIEGINFYSPVGSQTYDTETGKTWADYYAEQAIKRATSVYAIYDLAMSDESFELSEETAEYYDSFEDYMNTYATLYGYSSTNSYLRSSYGAGANVADYKTYSLINDTATEYYNYYMESLEYGDSDFREYEEDKYLEYSTFDYSVFPIDSTTYLTGGEETTDEDGETVVTYNDEEKAAALAAALADAKTLVEDATIADYTTFTLSVKLLEKYLDEDDPVTENTDVFYSKLSDSEMQTWLSSDERVPGDKTYIEIHDTDDNGEATDDIVGYYVLLFQGRDDNKFMLKNVRHILVQFTGGTTDSTTGVTTYTDEEKQTAMTAAEAILAEWDALEEKTAEAFGELANEHSDDGDGTTGGLYEDIYPGQMVESFEEWCYDENRAVGDVEIIESEYGYHIMYFVGDSTMTYRDYMINEDLIDAEMERWENELVEAMTVTEHTLKGLNDDFYLQ